MASSQKSDPASHGPRIDCRRCNNYYVTWDPRFPAGCKLFTFKSKSQPSITVWEATGAPCEHYSEKVKNPRIKK